MNKLAIVGCGRLAEIVADAIINGILPEYELTGVYSRSAAKVNYLANKMQQYNKACKACYSLDELLSLKPDYLVETASPMAMKELGIKSKSCGDKNLSIYF